MSQPNAIRILVVDNHPVVRQGLVAMLEEAPDILVVGQAGNGREGLAIFRQQQPDVTLMDLRMPEMDGVASKLGVEDRTQAVIVALRRGIVSL